MFRRIFWTILLGSMMLGSAYGKQLEVKISSPSNGSVVPWRACVQGSVSDPEGKVWLIIHPMLTDDFWVQPAIDVMQRDSSWKVAGYFGRQSGIDDGKPYQMRIIANPKQPLTETGNSPLSGWPEAEAVSDIVEVTRGSTGADGCVVTAETPAAVSGRTGLQAANPQAEASTAPSSRSFRNNLTGNIAVSIATPDQGYLVVLLTILLIILATLHKQAEVARLKLWRCVVQYAVWILTSVRRIFMLGVAATKKIFHWSMGSGSCAWAARGYKGDFKSISLRIMAVPLLALIFLFALYANSRAMLTGLEQIFPPSAAKAEGIIGSMEPASQEQTSEFTRLSNLQQVPPRSSEEKQNDGDGHGPVQLLSGAIKAFSALWKENSLGFMAVGLAAIEGALGFILLWNISTDQVLGMKIRTLFHERPILFSCFIGLDIALGFLAANRGFESGPEESVWIPALLSALMGLLMPWAMAYTLHLLFESVADCFGPAAAFAFFVSIWTAAIVFVVGTVLLLISAVTGMVAVFLAFVLLVLAAILFFLLAELLGNFFRKLITGLESLLRTLREIRQQRRENVTKAAPSPLVRNTLLLIAFLLLSHQAIAAVSANPPQVHDPAEDYTAWVFCIDTTRSPLLEQFNKLKAIFSESVKTDVGYNDRVWIIPIEHGFHPAAIFLMPGDGRSRLTRKTARKKMEAARRELLENIQQMRQLPGGTDLKDPVELGLTLLAGQRARRKFLVFGTDFIQDRSDRVTLEPPQPAKGLTAKDVRVRLLVTFPSSKYLHALNMTQLELEGFVQERWTEYFKRLGALSTIVEPVDAVALAAK